VARVIFHVDMDAFYVSVERREDPSLAGKQVIVGADPKGGRGRGVVMAASYEARELGIRAGMPVSRAYRILPTAVYLRPNYDLYGNVSENVMNVLREFADVLEHVSIDEAFLDVTRRVAADYDRSLDHAKATKTAVRQREGLTCSIGIAPNKSTAKIASEMGKPDGLTVVRPEEIQSFLAPLPVTRISGVGPKTAKVLGERGIRTIGDLAAYPGKELTKVLGKNAVWLWGIARGIEELPVEERPDPKSISVERTFERDESDWSEVVRTLEDVARNVYLRAVKQGAFFQTVGIKIRFEGFSTHTRDRTLPAAVQDEATLRGVSRELAEEFAKETRAVRLVGVRVSSLERPKARQARVTELG